MSQHNFSATTVRYILAGERHTIRWEWRSDGKSWKYVDGVKQSPSPETQEQAEKAMAKLKADGAEFVVRHPGES